MPTAARNCRHCHAGPRKPMNQRGAKSWPGTDDDRNPFSHFATFEVMSRIETAATAFCAFND